MTQVRQIYVCPICGNIVEVVAAGVGELVCCGAPMELQTENTRDAAREKHVPVARREGNQLHVQVGGTPHPMEWNHYIQWIEFIQGDRTARVELKPGEKPEAVFEATEEPFAVRAYCNLHGLWRS